MVGDPPGGPHPAVARCWDETELQGSAAPPETADARVGRRRRAKQFHCHSLNYFTVDTFGQMNGSHPTASQEISQPVRSALCALFQAPERAVRNLADVPLQRVGGVRIECNQRLNLRTGFVIDLVFDEISATSLRGQIRYIMEDVVKSAFSSVNSFLAVCTDEVRVA